MEDDRLCQDILPGVSILGTTEKKEPTKDVKTGDMTKATGFGKCSFKQYSELMQVGQGCFHPGLKSDNTVLQQQDETHGWQISQHGKIEKPASQTGYTGKFFKIWAFPAYEDLGRN